MKRELHWLVVVLVRAAVIGVVERTQVTMSTMSFSIMVSSATAALRTTTTMS